MKIEVIKKLIKRYEPSHAKYVKECMEAERYYENENDILYISPKKENSLRNADNRIPRNFHGLLVDQKAAYMFTAPPLFDVGNKTFNTKITDILGDEYAKVCKDLCVNASNCNIGWLHYWRNEKGEFEYGIVDSKQIIPVFSSSLKKQLKAVLRKYKDIEEQDGSELIIWEYWTEQECYTFKNKTDSYGTELEAYNIYSKDCFTEEKGNCLNHEFGEVPFIPFYNNNKKGNDLKNIKPLIDAYDKVFSGFLNDLEDIQEIIYVLTNYGGTDLKEFVRELKDCKAIMIEDDGTGKSGVETLTINIPIEAREKFLEITRRAIFEQGQGVDPDPEKYGNASGVALKYLYSLLELKAGFTETEFKLGFGKLIRAICKYYHLDCKRIIQTWTRTAVTNDAELADICMKSVGVISNQTILKNHPFVEDGEREERQIEEEKKKQQEEYKLYQGVFQRETELEEPENGGEREDEET